MLVPSAAAVQRDRLPAFAQSWDQAAFIDSTAERLAASGIVPVDVYATLAAHKDEYVYYRTDHHWTTDGAFLGFKELSKAMGLPARQESDFTVRTLSDAFDGTLYSKSGYRNVTADTIKTYDIGKAIDMTVWEGEEATVLDSIYNEEFLATKDKYAAFLDGNQALLTIRTASDRGKRLIVFKDSYAHCLVPMLLADYSEITVVDLRYLTSVVSDALDLSGYDEALFLYSMDTFTHEPNTSKLSLIP
jgi:hypothetical protein